MACAAALEFLTRGTLRVNLFFLPVILSCLFFRPEDLWAVAACAALNYGVMAQWVEGGALLFTELVNLVQWISLGIITILATEKYVAVKKYEMRLEKDISLAKTIQKALVSHPFEFKKVRITGYVHQSMQIGGDFYYFRPFGKKYVVFCLGDIMGKGLAAALTMAVVMGFFYEWGKRSFSPSYILARLNHRLLTLWGEDSNWFVTLFYCIYDEETMELSYASAGHHSALVLKPSGDIIKLSTEGLPAGIFEDSKWDEKKIALSPGDRVVLFTDGVTEARSKSGDMFSYDRLFQVLSSNRDLRPEKFIEKLVSEVREFSQEQFENDDMAILIAEIRE
jgi:sigma-B regulation protein RsbU (phosphoserine phosphatase)